MLGSTLSSITRQTQADRNHITHFNLELHSQGANAIIAIPDTFYGSVLGPFSMSPAFTQRASLIVQDEQDQNKTRYSVAPPVGTEVAANDLSTGTAAHSSAAHIVDEKRRGASAGKPYLCTLEEYAVEFSDGVDREGDLMVRYEHSLWPVRAAVYVKRLFTYGSKGEKVAFIVSMIGISFCLLPFLLIFWVAVFAPDW